MRHRPIDRAFKRLTNAFNFRQQMLLRLETELLERDSPPMVAAVSQYVADQMRQHHGLDTDHVEVVFNGVEAVHRPSDGRERLRLMLQDRHDLPADAALALFVAHNFKLKGLARLIEALPRVTGKVQVLVVGRDKPRRFQAQAARLGMADRLDFVGPVSNMAEYYGGVDFCVHPTYYDPCSRVVLEALSAGLPVVTTRHNGAAEVMEDGVHGFVIDSADDVPALAVAMNRLLDAERRTLMGECAQRLRQRVSMARHAEELAALYEGVLRRKGTR
jgi:UDP-glucose:(heptosyl)LPS alpha-1,3-glucosyltransferase